MGALLFFLIASFTFALSDASAGPSRPPKVSSHALFQSLLRDLNPTQQKTVGQGNRVLIEQKIAMSNWPRTRIYWVVDGTPEQLMGMFTDYAQHALFFPQFIASVPLAKMPGDSPRVRRVDYRMGIPFEMKTEDFRLYYTVENYVTLDGVLGAVCTFELAVSDQYITFDGTLRAEPFGPKGSGATLFSIEHHFDAGSLKPSEVRRGDVEGIVNWTDAWTNAIGAQLAYLKSAQPKVLDRQTREFLDMMQAP